MIKAARNEEDLDDIEFARLIQSYEDHIFNYLHNDLIYTTFATCIANAYDTNAIFEDSSLEYKNLLDNLVNMPKFDEINTSNLN